MFKNQEGLFQVERKLVKLRNVLFLFDSSLIQKHCIKTQKKHFFNFT